MNVVETVGEEGREGEGGRRREGDCMVCTCLLTTIQQSCFLLKFALWREVKKGRRERESKKLIWVLAV